MLARFSGALLVASLLFCQTDAVAQEEPTQGGVTQEECLRLRGQWRVPPGRCVFGWRLRSGEFELPDGETLSSEEFQRSVEGLIAANPGLEVNKELLGSEIGFAIERVT